MKKFSYGFYDTNKLKLSAKHPKIQAIETFCRLLHLAVMDHSKVRKGETYLGNMHALPPSSHHLQASSLPIFACSQPLIYALTQSKVYLLNQMPMGGRRTSDHVHLALSYDTKTQQLDKKAGGSELLTTVFKLPKKKTASTIDREDKLASEAIKNQLLQVQAEASVFSWKGDIPRCMQRSLFKEGTCLTMPFLGQTMASNKDRGEFTKAITRSYRQLRDLHSKGYAHRDLKSDNLLKTGQIIDPGLMQHTSDSATGNSLTVFTGCSMGWHPVLTSAIKSGIDPKTQVVRTPLASELLIADKELFHCIQKADNYALLRVIAKKIAPHTILWKHFSQKSKQLNRDTSFETLQTTTATMLEHVISAVVESKDVSKEIKHHLVVALSDPTHKNTDAFFKVFSHTITPLASEESEVAESEAAPTRTSSMV